MSEYSIYPEKSTLHGVLDASLKPALHIRPGDILHIETLEADWRIAKPDPETLQAPLFPERDMQRDAGHALCGPIYVEGVLPGDSLCIEILALEPGSWGWSSVGIGNSDHLDCLGFQGEEYFRIWDIKDGFCEDADGFRTPVDPFPGVLAVAPKGDAPVRTHIPGPHGGNLDCRELRVGTTVYLPVSHPGALFSIGDGHAAQGDGESGGTAVECPFSNISLRLSRAKGLLDGPVAVTKTHVITFGFDQDLTKAAYEALAQMRILLKKEFGISEKQAMTICSVSGDLHITQIVNGIRGVHAMLPLSVLPGVFTL